ncbi:MAG: tetratricopeptide repeat protein [Myxococcales bacterium]|nr:tetratricopeptide repeat protein [Myxococcales bacterium]
MPCLTENQVIEFVGAHLGPAGLQVVEEELARCEDCRQLVCSYARTTLLSGDDESGGAEVEALGEGATLARFELVDYLGSGGMGVVFLAHDPQLRRDIALKVLRPKLRHSKEATSLLLKEARAMAQIRHPNVLTIYDSGSVGDIVFIAVERASGGTLKTWLDAETRDWRDVTQVFVDAAAGIASAHEAGIVHRDIKPSNLLMSDDGTVLVADFGLALQVGEDIDTSDISLVGTPLYMSPEEFDGRGGDKKSDQFSFCVSLYESLTGSPPFPGHSVEALKKSQRTETLDLTPIPRPLRASLRRGLALEPSHRFPSMTALRSALRKANRPLHKAPYLLPLLTGAAAIAIVGGIVLSGEDAPSCPLPSPNSLWNTDKAETMHSALAALTPALGESGSRLDSIFSSYAKDWSVAKHAACRATKVEHQQSDEMLDRRMQCLARLRRDFGSLTTALQQPAKEDLPHALPSAMALVPPDSCSAERLLSHKQGPAIPPGVENKLSEARTLYTLGSYEEAAQSAKELLAENTHPYIRAHAGALHGNALRKLLRSREASENLQSAGEAAAEIGDDALATSIWLLVAEVEGYQLDQHEAGDAYLLAAEAALTRLGGDEGLQARLIQTRGLIASARGDHAAAQRFHEQTLKLREASSGEQRILRSVSLTLLGSAQNDAGKLSEAEASLRKAVALREDALGAQHPDVAHLLSALGQNLSRQGEFDEAFAELERARIRTKDAVGESHPNYAGVITKIGVVKLQRGDFIAANTLFEESLAIRRSYQDPGSSDIGRSLVNIAALNYNAGNYPIAQARYSEALEVLGQTLEKDHPNLASVHTGIGLSATANGDLDAAMRHNLHAMRILEGKAEQELLLANVLSNIAIVHEHKGQWGEALERFEEAIALHDRKLGPDHSDSAYLLTGLGESHFNLGNFSESSKVLRRAIKLQEDAQSAPQRTAEARLLLAYSLWHAPSKRGEARALAEQARKDLLETRPDAAADAATWLRSLRAKP